MDDWKIAFKNPHFPCGPEMESFFKNASDEKITCFINLWLSEGIPKIVLDKPEAYQLLRENLASYLDIHSKSITLIGSARFGYSLNPQNKYRAFQPEKSDLDLSIINQNLFEKFTEEFFEWLDDYEQGTISPNSYFEKINWKANKEQEPRKIKRGIFDLNRIPAISHYSKGQLLLNKLSIEQLNWNIKNPAVKVKKITIRFYKNWETFVSQNKINLRSLYHD